MIVTQDGLGGAIDTVSRSVTGGLLLPFLAYAIGNVCFKSVNNHLRRVILVSLKQNLPGIYNNNTIKGLLHIITLRRNW